MISEIEHLIQLFFFLFQGSFEVFDAWMMEQGRCGAGRSAGYLQGQGRAGIRAIAAPAEMEDVAAEEVVEVAMADHGVI